MLTFFVIIMTEINTWKYEEYYFFFNILILNWKITVDLEKKMYQNR